MEAHNKLPSASTRDMINRAVREIGRLRNYISCNGCGKLLREPQRITTCGHTVCSACAGAAQNVCPMTDCPIPMHRADVEPDHQAAAIVSAVLKVTRLACTDNPIGPLKGFPNPSAGPARTVEAVECIEATEPDRYGLLPRAPRANSEDDLFEKDASLPMRPTAIHLDGHDLPVGTGLRDDHCSGQTAGTDADTQPPPGAPRIVTPDLPADPSADESIVASPLEVQPTSKKPMAPVHLRNAPEEPLQESTHEQSIVERLASISKAKTVEPEVVCLSKLSRTDRHKCEATCRAFGYELARDFDGVREPTVVVTRLDENGEVVEFSFATLMALLRQVPIVSHEWLADVERMQREQPANRYLAKVTYADPQESIFDGVLAVNEMETGTQVATDFSKLLRAGGCRVVDEDEFAVECAKSSWHTRIRVMPDGAETPASWSSLPDEDGRAIKTGTEFLTLAILQGRFPPVEESELLSAASGE